MTKQEYWELLQRSARDGTFPSRSKPGHGGCLYRGDRTAGCKQRCAVGLLIPDEKYTPEIEGLWAGEHRICTLVSLPTGLIQSELEVIQSEHDVLSMKWDADKFLASVKDIFEEKEEDE